MPRSPKVPPLVGKSEAAEILKCNPNNMGKLRGLPAPLQEEEGPDGEPIAAVRATPVWRRCEIEQFAAERQAREDQAAAAAS